MSNNGAHPNGHRGQRAADHVEPPPADDGATQVGSLDMERGKDREYVRNGSRWQTDEKFRHQVIRAAKIALTRAMKSNKVRQIASCIRVIATLEAQNQTDQLNAEKIRRLDLGQPTEHFVITPEQEARAARIAASRLRPESQPDGSLNGFHRD